jgi:dihydrofolate reductase
VRGPVACVGDDKREEAAVEDDVEDHLGVAALVRHRRESTPGVSRRRLPASHFMVRRYAHGDGQMAKLIYSAITSLDGYVADEDGKFDWSMPDEEVHAFVNDLERSVGTYLYGRRMYEVMVAWESPDTFADQQPVIRDYAEIWQDADKVVYSKTLEVVSSSRTRIERDFDADAIREMKVRAVRDLSVGGPELAAQAIEAGLVDELHLFLSPIVVGGGKQSLPDGVRLELDLLSERRFGNGVVHLHYST